MEDYQQDAQQGAPRVVETASATTDPGNAHSGNAGYIIALVALVAMLGVGMLLSSCMELAGRLVADEMQSSQSYSPDGTNDPYEIFEYLDDGMSVPQSPETYSGAIRGIDA